MWPDYIRLGSVRKFPQTTHKWALSLDLKIEPWLVAQIFNSYFMIFPTPHFSEILFFKYQPNQTHMHLQCVTEQFILTETGESLLIWFPEWLHFMGKSLGMVTVLGWVVSNWLVRLLMYSRSTPVQLNSSCLFSISTVSSKTFHTYPQSYEYRRLKLLDLDSETTVFQVQALG